MKKRKLRNGKFEIGNWKLGTATKFQVSSFKFLLGFVLAMTLGFHSYSQSIDVGSGTAMNIPSGISLNTSGAIKLESTAAIDNSGTITLAGNWTNNGNGLINGSPGTVAFNGTGAQTIGGASATTFNNLSINNGAAVNNNVSLSDNITVSGTLAFSNGNIVTGSDSVVISSSGSISGASTGTGWVNGNLERDFETNSGAQTFKYEMGDSVIYAPATLVIRNVNTGTNPVNITGYIAATDANENVPTINASNINQAKKANRYWFMNENSSPGTFDSYDITLDFTNTTNTGTTANYIVRKYDPYTWSSTTSSVTGTTIKATGLISFGDFEVGENGTITFTAKLYIQGYYLGGGKMSPLLHLLNIAGSASTDVDTITVELHNRTSPYDTAYTAKGILQSDGSLSCSFPATSTDYNYYIAVKHRNALETWSADSASVTATYDFTTAQSKAYNGNMIDLGSGVYGIYSGDVTNGTTLGVQDGYINSSDKNEVQDALPLFKIGVYDLRDLTGDGFVDEDDYRIIQNNIPLNISVQRPQ